MATDVKVPESRGPFRKEVYERSVKIVKKQQSPRFPYRAVGESPRDSAWDRDRALEDLSGLEDSDQ